MYIDWTRPVILIALLAVPLIVAWGGRGPWGMSPARRRVVAGLRAAEVIALVLALAGTRLLLGGDSVTTIFAVDVSRSSPGTERGAALEVARRAVTAMRPEDRAGLVAFAAQPMVEVLPQPRPRQLALQTVPAPDATDLSAMIRLGVGLFPEGSRRRLAIFSDGNENRGDAIEAARAARAAGVAIDVYPFNAKIDQEVSLTGVSMPSRSQKDEPFELRVEAFSTHEGPATLRFFRDGQPIGRREVQLRQGQNVFSSALTDPDPGFHTYEAVLESADDKTPDNNVASGFLKVTGPAKALIVGAEADNASLAAALGTAPFTIETAPEPPQSIGAMQAYDAIFLNNVPAAGMRPEVMERLERYNRDLGGGLGMIGGENSFGPGGWIGTPLERALPVDMELKGKERLPSLAMVMVIDKSGSMQGTSAMGGPSKMEMAKEAAIAAIRLLGRRDQVGVVEFDSGAAWAVPLAPADPVTMETRVRGIGGGGGTDVYVGMKLAYQSLVGAEAMMKHMIVLTDGQTAPADFDGLLNDMAAARITVSTVGIGPDADAAFLGDLANEGGGRFYACPDPARTPRIFVRETILAQRAYLVEETHTPTIGASHDILNDPAMQSAPPLHGWVATELKSRAEPVLKLKSDPLLATWQYGLGKSVAYTSDALGRWSKDWTGWGGFGGFWDRTIRWSLRGVDSSDLNPRVEFDGGRGKLVVDAVDPAGQRLNFLDLNAALVTPDLERRELKLRQVSVGRYEAEFEADKPGAYMAGIVGGDGRRATAGGMVAYSPEFRDFGSNEFLLRELARLTGGRFAPAPEELFRRDGEITHQAREITRPLLIAAMALLLLEIAVRRVSLDDERRAWLKQKLGYLSRAVLVGRRYAGMDGAAATPEPTAALRMKRAAFRAKTQFGGRAEAEAEIQEAAAAKSAKPATAPPHSKFSQGSSSSAPPAESITSIPSIQSMRSPRQKDQSSPASAEPTPAATTLAERMKSVKARSKSDSTEPAAPQPAAAPSAAPPKPIIMPEIPKAAPPPARESPADEAAPKDAAEAMSALLASKKKRKQ